MTRIFSATAPLKLIFLLAVCATLSAPALAEEAAGKPARARLFCTASGERTEGLNKICYFNCGNSERAMKVLAYDACPKWKLRSGLQSSNRQFGPRNRYR